MRAHHEIVVEEFARALAVGADAADQAGEMDHDLRAQVLVHSAHRLDIAQIVTLAGCHEHVGNAAVLKFPDDVPSEKSTGASDEDTTTLPKIRHEILDASVLSWPV